MDYHSVLLNAITATINPQGTTILFVLLLGLLFLSFVVSGAEVAFFSLTYKDINLIKTKQQQPYKRILRLLEEPKILLGSLLIANSFINISIIIISNILIDQLFAFTVNFIWVEFIIKVIAVTSLLVLFAEVMPKVLATQNNIRFAKEMGPLVDFLQYLFKGMSKNLVKYSDVIERKLSKKSGNAITNEELYHAIDITDNGSNENEKNILKGILSFGDITAKQIMKARLDVHGIDYTSTYNEVLTQVKELHYSRIPIYNEDLDDIKGLLHTKDLIPFINEGNSFNWHSLIRPPYFVHEQKMIEDLLREFQSKHIHFAFVVDEFGGTSGIITLEDILEEVIGDIKDEFDEDELGYKKIDENNYVFEGRTMINDVCKIMSLNTDTFDAVKGESDSLAGLVLEIAGKIPEVNEIIAIGDFEFTILDVERTRINKIKVTIKPQTEE
ncbi:MAG: gliding motility-associated protein GldE [Bacteroidetes bacterium]|nr:gliding motility-associated protein GldE [Bacteroidota bacterium]MBS1649106.1 gliding motility-associated protein GldE [Bacteroidota bacterium]